MARKSTIEPPVESPIPFHHGSNGEFVPRPPGARERRAESMFRELVDERVRKLGVTRREFVDSMAGAATALLVIDTLSGCGGKHEDASWDASQACVELGGDQFVFDVQTHHVNPAGAWRDNPGFWEFFFASLPQGACGDGADAVDCFDLTHYTREVFVNSDTHVAVLTAVPADPGANPLEAMEIRETREIINELTGTQRLIVHGLVLPDQTGGLDAMDGLVEDGIAAWKVYTPYGGWRLDDDVGLAFLDRARELGITRVCAHKGLPLPGFDASFASPEDIGVVATQYTDLQFIVYHSGYETEVTEGAYSPTGQGIDRLIKSCIDHGIGPGGNVWAELGSTWRNVMTNTVEAQHTIGKLLKQLGPDRIVWGTDSIWYGSPQDQITAFRALTISEELQEQEGYPALTDEIKAKILGLNAAALYGIDPDETRCAIDEDDVARLKRDARAAGVRPRFRAYGPQTRRELFAFLRDRRNP
jgi:hypothetical protein